MKMKFSYVPVVYAIILLVLSVGYGNGQVTSLDKYIKEYRSLRNGLFNYIGRSDTDSSYLWNLKRQVR